MDGFCYVPWWSTRANISHHIHLAMHAIVVLTDWRPPSGVSITHGGGFYPINQKYYRSCIVTMPREGWKKSLNKLSVVHMVRISYFFFGLEKYAEVIYWTVIDKREKSLQSIQYSKDHKRNNPETMLNNKLLKRKSLESGVCVYI